MTVNGIIAEYNPFHNGHRFQLEDAKQATGADYTVIVMGGNFLQRGTPAILEKHIRTRMALLGGADLVIELPSVYACSSAEYFAHGAVSILDKLGVVDHLCFGTESGDMNVLKNAAEILYTEPEEFKASLQMLLRHGCSYPVARNEALIQYKHEFADACDLFRFPNNILGIEYLKALLEFKSSLKPYTTTRQGEGYHSPVMESTYCSAFSIRQALYRGVVADELANYLPAETLSLLSKQLKQNAPLTTDCLSSILYYKLLQEKANGYSGYLDVSQALSDRILNKLNDYTDYEGFCETLKTKELTYARISRSLLHIILNLTEEDLAIAKELNYTPYARVLGFRKSAKELLNTIKHNSSIPLIVKPADAAKQLNADELIMFEKDLQISQLYYGLQTPKAKTPHKNEYTIPIEIL